MAPQKRRLTDLWVTGREVPFDDGQGDPVVIWLQKLNTIESAEAARGADAARSRVLSIKNDHDSDEYQAVVSAVLDYGTDIAPIIDFLIAEDRARLNMANEAEMAAAEEWSKDNYLQGLRDSWNNDGLKERWVAADPKESDVEANHVYLELKRFTDELNDSVERDLEGPRERLANTSLEDLRTKMVERMLELDAGQAWLDEFYRQQLYYGTRLQENHGERYFLSRVEVNELSTPMYRKMRSAFEDLEVDVMEGKGSQAPPPSSPPSEASDVVVTEPSSGLVDVGA